jgi:hypothetical protein
VSTDGPTIQFQCPAGKGQNLFDEVTINPDPQSRAIVYGQQAITTQSTIDRVYAH